MYVCTLSMHTHTHTHTCADTCRLARVELFCELFSAPSVATGSAAIQPRLHPCHAFTRTHTYIHVYICMYMYIAYVYIYTTGVYMYMSCG